MGGWTVRVPVDGIATPVTIDLLVPESLGGPGRRGARIPPHARTAARKARGLEGALVDRDRHVLRALDPSDARAFELDVAGPGALLVAKIHKILDRIDTPGRSSDKDAADVLRLLRSTSTEELVSRLERLANDKLSRSTTNRAITELPRLFGSPRVPGVEMAVRATATAEPAAIVISSLTTLATDLSSQLKRR